MGASPSLPPKDTASGEPLNVEISQQQPQRSLSGLRAQATHKDGSSFSLSGLTLELRAALGQLAKAREYARETASDPWEFAIEIDRLTSLGITTSDLRWLIKRGIIEHAREITRPGDPSRQFQRSDNLAFDHDTCFLLGGVDSLEKLGQFCDALPSAKSNGSEIASKAGGASEGKAEGQDQDGAKQAAPTILAQSPASRADTPRWDGDDRTLYFGEHIVKEFRVRSPNQEAILAAFQEEGWPRHIDDPLSPMADQNPKQRLRDTIKCLNARHKLKVIRFRGDGTGERVRWELIDD
jgi:hypothetical protein